MVFGFAIYLMNSMGSTLLMSVRPPITIYLDNQDAQAMADAELTAKRSKHMDISYHYTREKVRDGIMYAYSNSEV